MLGPKRIALVLLTLLAVSLFDLALSTQQSEARSRFGGRSFGRSRTYRPSRMPAPSPSRMTPRRNTGSFGRGLAGGLLGGAVGSLLFGGMARGGMGGLGGSGIGLFQILLFGGIAYFIYKRFLARQSPTSYNAYNQSDTGTQAPPPPPFPPNQRDNTSGVGIIQNSDPDFDPQHFRDVAEDVFFQVQAGWIQRDLSSYRHLIGEKLAQEHMEHFAKMEQKGHLNKLENIAVRNVEIVDAGQDGNEEFVSILFTANLLDYIVDEKSGEVLEGSKTAPVKFAEEWTWARIIGSSSWRLEGIKVIKG